MQEFSTGIKLVFLKRHVCISLTDVIFKSEVSACFITVNFVEIHSGKFSLILRIFFVVFFGQV